MKWSWGWQSSNVLDHSVDTPKSPRWTLKGHRGGKSTAIFRFLQPQPQGNLIVGGRIMATTDVENSKGGMSFFLTRGAVAPRSWVKCLLLISLSSSYLPPDTNAAAGSTQQSREAKGPGFCLVGWKGGPAGDKIVSEKSQRRELKEQSPKVVYELLGSILWYSCIDLTLKHSKRLENWTVQWTPAQSPHWPLDGTHDEQMQAAVQSRLWKWNTGTTPMEARSNLHTD